MDSNFKLLEQRAKEGYLLLEVVKHFAPFVSKSDVHILPCDEPEKGCVGFNVFCEDDKKIEHSGIVSVKIFPDPQKIMISSKEEFENIYNKAKFADYLIQQCDNPVTRTLGFIVHKGSGSFYYQLRLKSLVES